MQMCRPIDDLTVEV